MILFIFFFIVIIIIIVLLSYFWKSSKSCDDNEKIENKTNTKHEHEHEEKEIKEEIKKKTLVIKQTPSGWGDNVVNIVSGLYLAKLLNRETILDFTLPLEQSFEINIPHKLEGDHNGCIHYNLTYDWSYERVYKQFSKENSLDMFDQNKECIHFSTYYPIYYFSELNNLKKETFSTLFENVFTPKFNINQNDVVIHIRAGDHYIRNQSCTEECPCIKEEEFVLMFQSIKETLKTLKLSKKRFIIVTDWEGIIDKAKEHLTDYAIHIEHFTVTKAEHSDSFTDKDYINFQNMLQEFYAIANCNTLFICDWSNFGKTAALLGRDKNIFCCFRPHMQYVPTTYNNIHLKYNENDIWSDFRIYLNASLN